VLSQERLEGAGPSGAWKFPLTALAPTSLARSRNDLTLFVVRETGSRSPPLLTTSLAPPANCAIGFSRGSNAGPQHDFRVKHHDNVPSCTEASYSCRRADFVSPPLSGVLQRFCRIHEHSPARRGYPVVYCQNSHADIRQGRARSDDNKAGHSRGGTLMPKGDYQPRIEAAAPRHW